MISEPGMRTPALASPTVLLGLPCLPAGFVDVAVVGSAADMIIGSSADHSLPQFMQTPACPP